LRTHNLIITVDFDSLYAISAAGERRIFTTR
jgi:hypothetical protein